jgi:hypothetical protein
MTQLAHLLHHATGLLPPQQLHTHPLRACQVCHDARVRKQPAGHVQPATDIRPGSRFHLAFGFMRASSYQREKGKDRVVLSHDGYNAYCLITDACSRYTWCFLTTSKEPPVNILDMFLTRHGLQDKNTPRSIRPVPRSSARSSPNTATSSNPLAPTLPRRMAKLNA